MTMDFYLPVKVFFGKGKLGKLKELTTSKKVLIVSDENLKKLGFVQRLKSLLSDSEVFEFCEVEPNPSCETVDRGAVIIRKFGIDTVIALGGGSVMDSAKAIACLLSNEGNMKEYLNKDKIFNSRIAKLICMPTTSGTGSEVTNVGVYTDKQNGAKKALVSEFFWSDYAIVDPEFTYNLPQSVTSSTGLDALAHAIESYWAISSQPVSESLAMKSIELVLNNLEKAYLYQDTNSREKLSMASLLAGMAFSQTRTTILHAISYPLTNIYNVPHGFACAISMAEIIKINYTGAKEKMDKLIKYLGYDSVITLVDTVERLLKVINAPRKLSEVGVKAEELERLAEISLSVPIADLNPVKIAHKQLVEIFRRIY